MSYNCVNNYLADTSCDPQRMTVTCCQSENGRNFVSFAISEVSRRTAAELVDSKYFEAAFNSADNRKSLRNACEKAKRFYMEVLRSFQDSKNKDQRKQFCNNYRMSNN